MKEIFIRRYEPDTFLRDYPDIVATSIQRIGSVYDGPTPLRGFANLEEEKKYLPQVIGVSANDPSFAEKATEWWIDLSLNVPIDGVKLNVGLDKNNNPLNIRDWVIYQWILRHPHVERSKGAAEGNAKARFYIHDPDEEVERLNKEAKIRLQAMKELSKIIEGVNSDENLERLTRVLISQNPDRLSRPEMENLLSDFAQTQPQKFLAAAQNKKLELHDLVLQLNETNVIQKIGEQYRYNDDTIAGTLDEMIAFLDNSKNSRVVGEMKAKLQEAKKPLYA